MLQNPFYIKLASRTKSLTMLQPLAGLQMNFMEALARLWWFIDPLHKWRLHLNNNTYTSLASHSCKKSFVLKHEYEAKDVSSIVIQIWMPFMQRVYF